MNVVFLVAVRATVDALLHPTSFALAAYAILAWRLAGAMANPREVENP